MSAVNTAEDGMEFVDQTGGGGSDDGVVETLAFTISGQEVTLTAGLSVGADVVSDTLTLPSGGGGGGTAQALSRFEALTTANTTAQAMSTIYADILEIATTDIFANVGGFTVATVSNITTITVPNNGLFKITAHLKAVTAGSARSQLYLRANILRSGVVVANSDTIMGGGYVRAISGAFSGPMSGTTTHLLETGDTITFQAAEEANSANTYTFGGADQVVEIVEIPSEAFAGEGVAAGGTDTQILAKASDADFDTEWIDAPTGGGGGGADDGVVETIAFAADGTVTLTRSVGADITTDASTALALLTGATFTGAVSGVTPADDDNSTQFATTEFVADGFHGASFTNATRRLVLSRLGGGAVASLPLTFLNASHGTDPIVAAEYHQGDTVKVSGNVYYYNANISATIATSAVATDTRFDNLTAGSVTPVGDHSRYLALGADAVFTESDYTSGTEFTTDTFTFPTFTTASFPGVVVPATNPITTFTQLGALTQDVTHLFTQLANIDIGGTAHEQWVGIQAFPTNYSGIQVRIS